MQCLRGQLKLSQFSINSVDKVKKNKKFIKKILKINFKILILKCEITLIQIIGPCTIL